LIEWKISIFIHGEWGWSIPGNGILLGQFNSIYFQEAFDGGTWYWFSGLG
jgi:hypothetical protein